MRVANPEFTCYPGQMRWSLLLSLAAFLFTLPASAAPPPAKPKPKQVSASTAKPVVQRVPGEQPQRIGGRNLRAGRVAVSQGKRSAMFRSVMFRSAANRHAQYPHPGLDGSGIEAGNFCGQMQMPAAELVHVSRGMTRGHVGIDLMAPHGSPAHAAAAGTVIYAGWYYAYGNIVDISHADGVVTRYAHLSAVDPKATEGATVPAGAEIGKVGATGHATGPHIHFEVRVGGRPVNPKPYLGMASCTGVDAQEEILEAYAADPAPRVTRRAARNANRSVKRVAARRQVVR